MPGVSEIEALFERYLPFIPEEYLAVLVILILAVGTVLFLLRTVVNPVLEFTRLIKLLFETKKEEPTVQLEDTLRPDIKVLRDVWLKDRTPNSIATPRNFSPSTKVISVINMKGGVGKTTVSANLGAALKTLRKRVLFIDFDYQGSLSMMVAGGARMISREIGAESYRTLYPTGAQDPSSVITKLSGRFSNCGIAGASYALFRDEMEQFALWSADSLDYDVRTQFRDFVSSDYVQKNYDVVIIDCGPRFTTSTINALCGSTHFLVPTILDELSARAVSYLDRELSRHREDLFPHLKLIGILPTFIGKDPGQKPRFSPAESEQLDQLEDAFESYTSKHPLLLNARIPKRVAFSKNSEGIAYFADESAKAIFDRAARYVIGNM